MSQTTDILKSIPFSSRRAVQLAAALAAFYAKINCGHVEAF